MFKPLLARRAANATKKILDSSFDCDHDCADHIALEGFLELTMAEDTYYCFGFLPTKDESTGRTAGTGFAILNGDEIEISTYDENCNLKKSAKNFYAATTPANEGRIFKIKTSKFQKVQIIPIPVTSYSATITLADKTIKENAKFYLSLDNNVPHKITSSYTFYENNNHDEAVSYIIAFDPNYFEITAQDGYKSTGMFSEEFNDININGYEVSRIINSTGGIIVAMPSELVGVSTISPGTYTAESTITIKHNTANLPGKFIELTANSIFTKSAQSSDGTNDDSNSKTTTNDKSDSKTGLIVGVVIGVVVVVAIVAFCVYWFACRSKSDDKEETPKV